jgi:hypothetical protein
MSFSTDDLAAYLGRSIRLFLSDAPFKDWHFDRTVEADLAEPVIF